MTTRDESLFQVHVLNELGMEKARELQALFENFLGDVELTCGSEGREMAVVRTKLQEAAFFAKRSMAMRPENQAATE